MKIYSKRKRILFFLEAYMIGLTIVDSVLYFDCYEYRKSEGWLTFKCNPQSEDETRRLPLNIRPDVENLTIDAGRTTLEIDSINTFRRITDLKFIQIVIAQYINFTSELRAPDEMEKLRKELFNLPNLLFFEVKFYKQFNIENRSFVMPKSLRQFGVENSYVEYDLRECPNLEFLNLRLNKLSSLPALSEPKPPLKLLISDYNKLDHVTVEDIAEFCLLISMKIENAELQPCQCVRIRQWMNWLKEWNKRDPNFVIGGGFDVLENVIWYGLVENKGFREEPEKSNVNRGSEHEDEKCDDDYAEAHRRRDKCLKLLDSDFSSVLFVGMLLVALVLMGVLICVCRSFSRSD